MLRGGKWARGRDSAFGHQPALNRRIFAPTTPGSREEVRDLALGASESLDEYLEILAARGIAMIEVGRLDPGDEMVEGGVNGPAAPLPPPPWRGGSGTSSGMGTA